MVAREKLEEASKKLDIRSLLVSSIITALAFVVGLFWNDAIRSAIETIIPTGDKVFYKFLAAVSVTIIVVVVSYLLYRSQQIKAHHFASIVEKERLLAHERFLKSAAYLKLKKKERDRIRREILKGQ